VKQRTCTRARTVDKGYVIVVANALDSPARINTAPKSAPDDLDDTVEEDEDEDDEGAREMDDKYGKSGEALRASYMVNCTAPWDAN
jgi:hypothetical protein